MEAQERTGGGLCGNSEKLAERLWGSSDMAKLEELPGDDGMLSIGSGLNASGFEGFGSGKGSSCVLSETKGAVVRVCRNSLSLPDSCAIDHSFCLRNWCLESELCTS